jgi:AraC-like DNA-binding protein
MTLLSQRTLIQVNRAYRQAFGLRIHPVLVTGALLNRPRKPDLVFTLPTSQRTSAYSLQEALHWGEPYAFYRAQGVISWAVAMVDQSAVHGGLISDAVISSDGKPVDTGSQSLAEQGVPPPAARRYLARLPVWPSARIREAAMFLQTTFYQISGWHPLLLEENRLKAAQQRQISEAIDEQKKSGQMAYPIDKERMLLSLIRAGDQNGARRVLNEMLGAMYLFSPKLVILRARAIELMGYLTRAAVEDSPLMEPLIERNHQWMQKLIQARDFEILSHVLMQALDDFMEGIYAHGFNCYNANVSRIMDFIAQHYTRPVSLKQIAESAGLSVFRVSHLVKEQTGKTVLQHILQLRVHKAQQLLERTSTSCPEIAYAVGFCDQSYFIKHFKRLTGATPARYRRTRLAAITPANGAPAPDEPAESG